MIKKSLPIELVVLHLPIKLDKKAVVEVTLAAETIVDAVLIVAVVAEVQQVILIAMTTSQK